MQVMHIKLYAKAVGISLDFCILTEIMHIINLLLLDDVFMRHETACV